MNTSEATCVLDRVQTRETDLSGLDPREQFAATLHLTTEHYVEHGGTAEDAAYFLLAAARSALERKPDFSANTALAREYLQAALELL